MKPLSNRVVIRPDEAEKKTASGIIIPDSAKEKPLEGEIIFCGEGFGDEDMEVKVGDKVAFGKYAGSDIDWKGETYRIMRETDILAII